MTLNEIFRRSGEPTYYTPMAVVGQLVNQEGGTVVIGNPPFSMLPPKKKHFKKMWRLGGWRLYLTHNFRLRNSQSRDQDRNHNGICDAKRKKYNEGNQCCEICGKKLEKFCNAQIHHVLAWWRFPQFETDQRNLMLLCPECHNHIHKDPFIQTRMIEEKCKELGVNVSDYYDTPSEP